MKAFLPLIFVVIFGATALANTKTDVKIDSIEMGVVLVDSAVSIDTTSQIEVGSDNCIARLYRFHNSRVKKALSFATKRSKSKWS